MGREDAAANPGKGTGEAYWRAQRRQCRRAWSRAFHNDLRRAVRRLYTQADLPEDWNYDQYLGLPGEPPFTRGIHPTGYRGKLLTMRQFSGFASPEETNQRYKYLLEHGGSGLSVAFDLPTLMGYDSDHPASEGEVGKCGVAIDSLEDMEILFAGIDAGKDHGLHDHQLARRRCCGRCTWWWRKSRAPTGRRFRARFRTTS